jgi:hypothetical protein
MTVLQEILTPLSLLSTSPFISGLFSPFSDGIVLSVVGVGGAVSFSLTAIKHVNNSDMQINVFDYQVN